VIIQPHAVGNLINIFYLCLLYPPELRRILLNPKLLVAVSKGMRAIKLHQQNPPVLHWRCWLAQVDWYSGRKMVVVGVVSAVSLLQVLSDSVMMGHVVKVQTRITVQCMFTVLLVVKPVSSCVVWVFRADDEMQFDPNSFVQTMQKMFG